MPTLVLLARVVGNQWSNLLFLYSLYVLNREARKVGMEARCNNVDAGCSATTNLSLSEECINDSVQQLVLGLKMDEDWFRVIIMLVMFLVNLTVTLTIVCQASREARRSDLSLCFALNRAYYSRWVRAVRACNALVVLVSIIVALATRASSFQAVLAILERQLLAFINAVLATHAMHKPLDSLCGVPWADYQAHVTGHKWASGDLLTPAPQLLAETLTKAAFREVRANSAKEGSSAHA